MVQLADFWCDSWLLFRNNIIWRFMLFMCNICVDVYSTVLYRNIMINYRTPVDFLSERPDKFSCLQLQDTSYNTCNK